MLAITLVCIIGVSMLVLYSSVALSTTYDKQRDDIEQEKFIDEYNKDKYNKD